MPAFRPQEYRLRHRMVTLDLDPYEWALSEPALLRHLDRRCSQCESRARCTFDLAAELTGAFGPEPRQWRRYCPNAATLEMLSTAQKRLAVTPSCPLPYLG